MEQNQITPFAFGDNLVRVLRDENAEPWFVAKDVALALGYEWNGKARIAHVPDEWRGVTSVVTPSGEQEMLTLSEPGLYFFLGRSDKPGALPFQKWLAGEVLPAIRKTGHYAMPGRDEAALPDGLSSEAIRFLQTFSGPRIALTGSVGRLAELIGIADSQTAIKLFDVYASVFIDKNCDSVKSELPAEVEKAVWYDIERMFQGKYPSKARIFVYLCDQIKKLRTSSCSPQSIRAAIQEYICVNQE